MILNDFNKIRHGRLNSGPQRCPGESMEPVSRFPDLAKGRGQGNEGEGPWMGPLSWVMWVGQSGLMDPESREVSLAGGSGAAGGMGWRGVREVPCGGRPGCASGATVQGHRHPLGARGSSWQPARRWGPQSHICRNLPSHNQVNEPGSGLSEEQRPGHTCAYPERTCGMWNLHNRDIVNGCCSQELGLWSLSSRTGTTQQ